MARSRLKITESSPSSLQDLVSNPILKLKLEINIHYLYSYFDSSLFLFFPFLFTTGDGLEATNLFVDATNLSLYKVKSLNKKLITITNIKY